MNVIWCENFKDRCLVSAASVSTQYLIKRLVLTHYQYLVLVFGHSSI